MFLNSNFDKQAYKNIFVSIPVQKRSQFRKEGNGTFSERRILGLEQESERAKIRSDRSQGWRRERSEENVPFPG
ncbi:MAG: hypothetical protein DRH12_12480 [Deltaproteobacteria bacterium]|nr:MAG: hypothetical protein DRH12_12480 [Deltaproteobacteria bacterium]